MLQTGIREGCKSEAAAGRLDQKAKVFTECWNSWSHAFAVSMDALSGALLKTSRASRTACAAVAMLRRVGRGEIEKESEVKML